jgi:hypothetical protein
MKNALLLVLALAAAAGVRAVPLQRDLGLGLSLLRLHDLPADLAADAPAGRSYVLDLRYVKGGPAEGAALLAWLRAHAGPHTPVFLLANARTAPALLAPLNSPEAVTGLVIIGAAARGFEPDIALAVPAGAERRAYAALETGTAVDSLITVKNDKIRNDEASRAASRLPDTGADDPPKDDAAPAAKAAPPALIDPVLQCAVQVHRSLLALRRL